MAKNNNKATIKKKNHNTPDRTALFSTREAMPPAFLFVPPTFRLTMTSHASAADTALPSAPELAIIAHFDIRLAEPATFMIPL